MQIKNVLAEINRMQDDGIIASYAIGGAVGATFYLEPSATLDIDIFVGFETRPGSRLISPQPIYDYLTGRGYAVRGEGCTVTDSLRRIIEGKREERERLAALSFARKLEILEQLRSRSLELGKNPLRAAMPQRDGRTKQTNPSR
jgi:hypothetical protein